MNEKNKKNDYIMIDKRKVENYFFITILILAFILFIIFLVRGMINMSNTSNDSLNSDLISHYNDENLNIMYPVVGGDWVFGSIDNEGVDEIITESAGEDGYFDIEDDTLTSEILSSILFNDEGLEGYRQFMSFTFKPTVDYVNEEYLNYCIASLERDITSSGSGEYKNYEFVSAVQDDTGGVLLKSILTEENSDGDFKLYYTQYIQKVGKNIATVTFGNLAEDDTVDKYLQYFLNNIISEKSMYK